MSTPSNRTRVAQSFHRQAVEYDRHATVQNRVIKQVVKIVYTHVNHGVQSILDVGCGTGKMLLDLHEHFPVASLYGIDLADNMVSQARTRLGSSAEIVNGDAENLPYDEESFDLIVSSSTLQWLETLDLFFHQAYRALREGGMLCCAFFGGSTLGEMHQCFRDVIVKRCGEYDSRLDLLHRFISFENVKNALEASSFKQVVLSSDLEVEYHTDLRDMLRSIQKVGAGSSANASPSRGGLGWRGLLQEMSELYQRRHGRDGKIPANYEVFYLIAKKIM